mmetsp:Transcript_82169/g.236110  ORF Transcript_82169/g.236110 Transcript_82169/m.236110 type:complete len:95 (-) Transcript_82169:199-483(-)
MQQRFGPGVVKETVCVHWKSKGWCRYQNNCKFEHPPALFGFDATGRSAIAVGRATPTMFAAAPGYGSQLVASPFRLPFMVAAGMPCAPGVLPTG